MYNSLIYSVGMMLLHSLWQFLFIFLILRAVLSILKNATPSVRYYLSGSALILCLLLAISTFIYFYIQEITKTFPLVNASKFLSVDLKNISIDSSLFHEKKMFSFYKNYLNYIVPLYFICVLMLLLKLFLSMLLLRRQRTRGIIKPDPKMVKLFLSLKEKFELNRKIQIVESVLNKVPIVLGYIKPVIIVPAGIFMQMPVAQVEAILAHELSHIRRNDFIINFIQSFIEILFFYHPVVYVLSKFMREERELCCDEFALKHCHDSTQYVKALAGLENFCTQDSHPAMAFLHSRMNLLNRITRILKLKDMKTRITDKIIAAVIIFVGFLTILISGAATWNNFSGQYNLPIEDEASPYLHPTNTATSLNLKDTIIEFDGNRIITLHENQQGDQEKMELLLEDGKIIELKINDEIVPEEDYPEYSLFVEIALDEVKNASVEVVMVNEEMHLINEEEIKKRIEDALRNTKEINQEQIQKELEKARVELEKIDRDDLMREIEKAKAEARVAVEKVRDEHYDSDSLKKEIAMIFSSIDWEEINKSIDMVHEKVTIKEEEISASMKEAMEALQMIDWDQIQENVSTGLEVAMLNIESIDFDSLLESLNITLDISEDQLNEISISIEQARKDINTADTMRKKDSAKSRINNEKEKLQELEKNMEKALEDLEKK